MHSGLSWAYVAVYLNPLGKSPKKISEDGGNFSASSLALGGILNFGSTRSANAAEGRDDAKRKFLLQQDPQWPAIEMIVT